MLKKSLKGYITGVTYLEPMPKQQPKQYLKFYLNKKVVSSEIYFIKIINYYKDTQMSVWGHRKHEEARKHDTSTRIK